MFAAKAIATVLGIGYIKNGAGSVAAFICCGVWYLVQRHEVSAVYTIAAISILFFAGVWSSALVEQQWGKDSNKVVVDELFGMCVSLFLVPLTWKYIAASFILFRFFDIVKPLYIRKAESLPSGWGVMTDDLLAGIYANLVLQIALKADF